MQKNFIIATFAILGLSACTTVEPLLPGRLGGNISGTLSRGVFEPHRVEVRLDDKVYRGDWRSTAPSPEQRAATSFPHQKHIGQVLARLTADDGSSLDCRWQTHSNTAEGSCSDGRNDYLLTLN